jgi:hypothetical protein
MLFHAGMIELRLGKRTAAREKLAAALSGNPGFSVRYAPVARQLLSDLENDR